MIDNLTDYTIRDILYLRTTDSDHEIMAFKKNLVVELKENYKLKFNEIGYLLKTKVANLKEMYYCFKEETPK